MLVVRKGTLKIGGRIDCRFLSGDSAPVAER